MVTSTDAEDIPSNTPGMSNWLGMIWRRLSVRLLLLLGVVVFLTAVGIDSFQQASAADMSGQKNAASGNVSPVLVAPWSEIEHSDTAVDITGTYLQFDAETASRLQRSDLLGPHLTRSRLTSSHLFTHSLR